jgi:LacI family transcriptional regulator
MAAGVVRVANRRGVAIPEQLSVAGFDDNSMARQLTPALTTVRQPLAQMAATAAEGVIGKPETETIVVPGRLMIRESTGPVPADA